MNIADRIVDIQNALATITKNVTGLRGIEAKLTQLAAGSLPKRLTADLAALDEMDAAEMTDENFVKRLAEAVDTREPVKGMMNLAVLAARLKAAEKRIGARIQKLKVRAMSSGGDAEGDSAEALKARLVAAQKIMEDRLGIVLVRFFEIRLLTINATLKLTEKVCNLWKDGAIELRTAALNSSAEQAIASLGAYEKLATQGMLKVGGFNGKGSVKI